MSADEEVRLELDLKRAELRIKKTEVVAKYVSLLVLLIGIAIPFYQYVNTLEKEQKEREDKRVHEAAQRDKEVEAASREARKPFLERQQTLYFEAASAASKLATLEAGAERDAARKRFYHLFWGELSVVEDELVESAMVRFKNTLELYESGEAGKGDLEQMSLTLARSCRDSLARGWGTRESKEVRTSRRLEDSLGRIREYIKYRTPTFAIRWYQRVFFNPVRGVMFIELDVH